MDLGGVLRRIDGRGYKAYRRLLGVSEVIDGIKLTITRVQGDPFAPPSVVRVETSLRGLPGWALGEPVALADFMYRRLYSLLRRYSVKVGEGRSGFLGVPRPGPVMLRRSGLEVRGDLMVARVWVGLPSRRRRVLGGEAFEILLRKVPKAVSEVLTSVRSEVGRLREHVKVWQIQEDLRSNLGRYGLVAFVGDGSILPRRCGGCDDPLPDAVPFQSPPSLRVELGTRYGPVSGMGVRRGLTVIAGTAFHGKTTLLEAIQQGIYNHVPGDGRERVVSLKSAVKVRSENGRVVNCVDISTFIHNLPGGLGTECFVTENASGATSMAAAIQEAVEVGSKLILIDEDTSATNVLFHDERSEALIRRKTVTTVSEQAASLSSRASVVVVSSGSAPLIASATAVVIMEDYIPRDATRESKEVLKGYGPPQKDYRPPRPRKVVKLPQVSKPRLRGRWLVLNELNQQLDLSFNEQLVEEGQLRLLTALTKELSKYAGKTPEEIAVQIDRLLHKGFKTLLGREPGPDYSEVRGIDVVALINRLKKVKTT